MEGVTESTVPLVVCVKDDPILPRRYQEEIFEKAQQSNIIAALDTGSGKTFISVMLIRWMTSCESARGKVIVFLVPKIPLVDQQADFIMTQTPLRVCKLHGTLGIDMNDRASWRNMFKQNDVFVLTAQVFLNLLTHSHWSINKVSLMVFDECHHTRKNHPYNSIMREYFQVPVSERPRVFGMTASPIWNPKDAAGSLATLEQNLNAKIIGVRLHAEELANHAPKPIEIIKVYRPAPEIYQYLSPSLADCIDIFKTYFPWTNIQTRYSVTRNELGPYAADLYLYNAIKYHLDQVILGRTRADLGFKDNDMKTDEEHKRAFEVEEDLLQIQAILDDFLPFFENVSDPDVLPILIPLAWCSPKVHALIEVLKRCPTTFQGLVFVEQRQVAICLAKILSSVSSFNGFLRCKDLIGNSPISDTVYVTGSRNQAEIVRSFREGRINLLVATSVAEEGLDFPACDVVVRFDPIQHLVGYVQSRGRARNRTSSFIVMIQEDHVDHFARYKTFLEREPELRRTYQTRAHQQQIPDDDDEDETDQADLAERERYVVDTTGAILTYDVSISLLGQLCALIPDDPYTPPAVPKFGGDFEATLHLPSRLPLPKTFLHFKGPMKRTKREAKRAVAFLAVRRLHELGVFNDYLLPSFNDERNDVAEIGKIPEVLDVLVRDPWTTSGKLWLHILHLDGRPTAGLITGTVLPPVELGCDGSILKLSGASCLFLKDEDEDMSQLYMLECFTKRGISLCNTGRPISLPLSCFLVPLTDDHQPDFDAIQLLVDNPRGISDWSQIGEADYDQLILSNVYEPGRTLVLRRIRHELTTMCTPPPGSQEAAFPTYRDYFVDKYTTKRKHGIVQPTINTDEPLLETHRLPRRVDGTYDLASTLPNYPSDRLPQLPHEALFPQNCCRWHYVSLELYRAFCALPQLCRRITDVYRARQARFELCLPPIVDNLLVEALTLPPAQAKFNNQRLETLGDAVLKLTTTVHLFNTYPYRHEGQLSSMRQSHVSNKKLLACAKEVDLEHFLTSETQMISIWRYVNDPFQGIMRFAQRKFPRRSLQDCMEATLGAAFLTGGIPMALRAGDALGLAMGGSTPWPERYKQRFESCAHLPPLFLDLQESLGYDFNQSSLLIEAVTHASLSETSSSASYQRLEFLGDAAIDLVVTTYLFDKFPDATSDQLSLARSRAVCAPALAAIAIQRLGIHKLLLINNVRLSIAVSKCAPILESVTAEQIVNEGWRMDPPKVISDVFESLMGAILVDSGHNYDRVSSVVEYVMSEVLAVLSPQLRRDPVSELMEWVAKSGCQKIVIQEMNVRSFCVAVHDVIVAGPISDVNKAIAKGVASEKALLTLRDETSKLSLVCLCNCETAGCSKKRLLKAVSRDECDGISNAKLDEEGDEEEERAVEILLLQSQA